MMGEINLLCIGKVAAGSTDRNPGPAGILVKRVMLTLQAKEGRRPRPVVPGSLRAGCFSVGKI